MSDLNFALQCPMACGRRGHLFCQCGCTHFSILLSPGGNLLDFLFPFFVLFCGLPLFPGFQGVRDFCRSLS